MSVDFIRKKRLVTGKKSHFIEIALTVVRVVSCKEVNLTKNKNEKSLCSIKNYVLRSHILRRFNCSIFGLKLS